MLEHAIDVHVASSSNSSYLYSVTSIHICWAGSHQQPPKRTAYATFGPGVTFLLPLSVAADLHTANDIHKRAAAQCPSPWGAGAAANQRASGHPSCTGCNAVTGVAPEATVAPVVASISPVVAPIPVPVVVPAVPVVVVVVVVLVMVVMLTSTMVAVLPVVMVLLVCWQKQQGQHSIAAQPSLSIAADLTHSSAACQGLPVTSQIVGC